VAKDLSIARANAYQALNGLVSKGAAERLDETPQRYRAIRQDALLSILTAAGSERLDTLEAQMVATSHAGGEANVQISGRRALLDVLLRTAAREQGTIHCLAPPNVLEPLSPVWRKRQMDGRTTHLWLLGGHPPNLPIPAEGVVNPERVYDFFHHEVAILIAGDAAVVARLGDGGAVGHWTSDAVLSGLCRSAFAHFTAP
jgi:hypothetical protein